MSFNDLWGIDKDASTPSLFDQGQDKANDIFEGLLSKEHAQEAENRLFLLIDHWDSLPDEFIKGFVKSCFTVLIHLFTVLRK